MLFHSRASIEIWQVETQAHLSWAKYLCVYPPKWRNSTGREYDLHWRADDSSISDDLKLFILLFILYIKKADSNRTYKMNAYCFFVYVEVCRIMKYWNWMKYFFWEVGICYICVDFILSCCQYFKIKVVRVSISLIGNNINYLLQRFLIWGQSRSTNGQRSGWGTYIFLLKHLLLLTGGYNVLKQKV